MKPLNICPVRVGDYVRYGSRDWEQIVRIGRNSAYNIWFLYTDDPKDGNTPLQIISESNMCGMEVKRDTDQ